MTEAGRFFLGIDSHVDQTTYRPMVLQDKFSLWFFEYQSRWSRHGQPRQPRYLTLRPSQIGRLLGVRSLTRLRMTRFGRYPPWIWYSSTLQQRLNIPDSGPIYVEGIFHPAQEQMTASYLQRLLGMVACTFHLYAKTSAILSDCKESLLAGWKAVVAENLWSP